MKLRALIVLGMAMAGVGCGESQRRPVQAAPQASVIEESDTGASNRASVVGGLLGIQHGASLNEEALRSELLALLEVLPRDPFVLANLGTLSFRAGEREAGLDFYRRWYEEEGSGSAGLALANELIR